MIQFRTIISGLLFLIFALSQLSVRGQKNSAQLFSDIEKLGFLGSVMYVAAHPDDENTNLISYLANEIKAHTVYLSLTRGDGGQNLIGTEMRELLGLIRTRELLEARKVDGGHQFFTRANDFGYSKHPDETLKIWNEEAIRSDVIQAIRKWQPDIIINRFDHESAGKTHGHHTTSAMLSFDCFDQSGDPNVFPGQLDYVSVWKASKLFFNTSWWFYGSQEAFDKADKSDLIALDVGVYYPHLGYSNNEISARSRSMHKSQGFGSTPIRGKSMEYLKLLKGSMPHNQDLFDGINTSWSRIPGGEKMKILHAQIVEEFDHKNPQNSVPALVHFYRELQNIPQHFWTEIKAAEIKQLIADCSGLYLEAASQKQTATHSETIKINLEAINRSSTDIQWKQINLSPGNTRLTIDHSLDFNQVKKLSVDHIITTETRFSSPYWLEKESETGLYTVDDPNLRGLPENPASLTADFDVVIEGQPFTFSIPVNYKYTDPVAGEVKKPFEVLPPATVKLTESNYLFSDNSPRNIFVEITSGQENIAGVLRLNIPEGWNYEPKEIPFSIDLKGDNKKVEFTIYPSYKISSGRIEPIAQIENRQYNHSKISIQYPHIPVQTVLKNASAPAIRIDLLKSGKDIGYVMGAGDEVPAALTQIGYSVTLLDEISLASEALHKYDAIVVGIRAYNTNEYLKYKHRELLKYVENGGTLLIQYNTSNDLVIPADQLAPYPLKLSRGRITDENSPVVILNKSNPVLNYPNQITQNDFNGWVQERGLYFPGEWAPPFEPILAMNDPDEGELLGSIVIAPYGKGHYIYSGLSWFRQLPAGVPGAFRIFANLLSIGKNDRK
jgi:LmbE family N-acetylglucosaminyl deacetylase